MTSTTLATSANGVSSCTSVSTGTPILARTSASTLRPASMPGPRKLFAEERFALSYDALKMNGTPRRVVMSLSLPAISCVNVSPSITQGPAMRKNGRSMPTWKLASNTRLGPRKRVAKDTRGGPIRANVLRDNRARSGAQGIFGGCLTNSRRIATSMSPPELIGMVHEYRFDSRVRAARRNTLRLAAPWSSPARASRRGDVAIPGSIRNLGLD